MTRRLCAIPRCAGRLGTLDGPFRKAGLLPASVRATFQPLRLALRVDGLLVAARAPWFGRPLSVRRYRGVASSCAASPSPEVADGSRRRCSRGRSGFSLIVRSYWSRWADARTYTIKHQARARDPAEQAVTIDLAASGPVRILVATNQADAIPTIQAARQQPGPPWWTVLAQHQAACRFRRNEVLGRHRFCTRSGFTPSPAQSTTVPTAPGKRVALTLGRRALGMALRAIPDLLGFLASPRSAWPMQRCGGGDSSARTRWCLTHRETRGTTDSGARPTCQR